MFINCSQFGSGIKLYLNLCSFSGLSPNLSLVSQRPLLPVHKTLYFDLTRGFCIAYLQGLSLIFSVRLFQLLVVSKKNEDAVLTSLVFGIRNSY